MTRLISSCLVFFLLGLSISHAAPQSKKHFVFSDKSQAEAFADQQVLSGKKTNLTTQKKPKKRYFVLLKGYSQWTPAFKQAQALMKQGLQNVEVTKGRFERGYSVLVFRSFDRKKAGQAFNRLKGLGLRNVKVHTEIASKYQYIVSVHTPKKSVPKTVAPIYAKPTSPKLADAPTEAISKVKTKFKTVTKPIQSLPLNVAESVAIETEDDSLIIILDDSKPSDDDSMIIVMSDTPEMTYEFDIDESDIDDSLEIGAAFNLESDLFSSSSQDVNHSEFVHGELYLKKQFSSQWDVKLSARVDGTYQRGRNGSDYSNTELDYGDSYVRYREEDFRVTVGAQTIRWGRVDNLGPLDNMATLDLSRGVLLKWGENYRSSPAIRIESFLEQGKLDFVYLPDFREAELADKEDVWSPIDFRNGRMLGFKSTPLFAALLPNARIDDDISGDGGFGLRYSTTMDSFDLGLTVQRVRLSTPYYRMHDAIRQAIQTNNPQNIFLAVANSPYAFKEEHPRTWVVGADTAFEWKTVTWRMEGGWFSDLPATTTALEYKTYKGLQWAGSAEFYPGDADTRVNLQLSGRHLNEKEKILDLDNVVALSGEVESLFANNRWKLSGRFKVGLSDKDYVLSPEIAFLGWEPFEIYMAYHYLDGDEQTVGGFYQKNNMLTFGLSGKY